MNEQNPYGTTWKMRRRLFNSATNYFRQRQVALDVVIRLNAQRRAT
ncbi:MAG: hypothetical protein M3R15_29265 [Acidobacteriota bacterium]|nr:hypothetical protein [Acidobacteriota bacterium]